MNTVTISPKFQVVIPQAVRESMQLKAGTKVEVFELDGRIQIIPIRPMAEMRGFLRGMDTTIERDEEDRV